MDAIIELLNKKNYLLKKFYTVNKAEIFRIQDGDFNHLEDFYRIRENTLDMISHVDVLIEEQVEQAGPSPMINNEQKQRIDLALQFKDDTVSKILDQDLRILELIEQAKSNIIRELQGVSSNRKVLTAYNPKGTSKRYDQKA